MNIEQVEQLIASGESIEFLLINLGYNFLDKCDMGLSDQDNNIKRSI